MPDKPVLYGDSGSTYDTLMEKKDGDPWLAGQELSLADVHLGPILFYVSLTPEKDRLIRGAVADWWQRLGSIESFRATEPNLG